jgi:hypothetical protein
MDGATLRKGPYMRTFVLLLCALAVCPSVVTSQEVEPTPSRPGAALVADTPIGMRQAKQAVDGKRSRKGFWFNGGLGYGAFGCRGCEGRVGDWSGGLALGWSLSQQVLLGVGANGWIMSENNGNLSAGILGAVIRLYPWATGRFFLLGGFGAGAVHGKRSGLEGETQAGYGTLGGLGYDILMGNSVSLTPFLNWFAANTSESDVNVWQVGLGITVH